MKNGKAFNTFEKINTEQIFAKFITAPYNSQNGKHL